MIYYFSGTGNSRWVAQQLAAATHDSVCDMAVCLRRKTGPDEALAGAEVVGFVFPIHSWYAPHPVRDFMQQLSLPRCRYRYAVCTCGDDVGKGMSRLAGHFPLDAAWSVTMPNTYIPMFRLDDDALCRRKVAEARLSVGRIAQSVNRRERVWQVHEGGAAWLKTYVVHPLFERFCVRTKGFRAERACTACGLCSRVCPMGNVSPGDDGRPVWGTDCIHCMACVHACPVRAIQYNKVTRNKGRYRLVDYL